MTFRNQMLTLITRKARYTNGLTVSTYNVSFGFAMALSYLKMTVRWLRNEGRVRPEDGTLVIPLAHCHQQAEVSIKP